MDLNGKNILVMGLGISGISTIRALDRLGAHISISDSKTENELGEILDRVSDIALEKFLGKEELNLSRIDLIVKSPGIPLSNKTIEEAIERKIPITNDIEIGSLLSKSKNIIAITGTNGKTTTTTLTGEIFKNEGLNAFIGGNIGKSVIQEMIDAKVGDVFILETSSFQLENTLNFKPKISLIINITPDHLDWHGSFENYIESKKKIFKNQDKSDFTILNYDDPLLKTFESEVHSNIIYFSVKEKLERGVFIEDGNIVIKLDKTRIGLLPIDQLLLKGKHNLENVLGSVAISFVNGVKIETIRDTILSFKGVEHRLEFVEEKNGRKFFNDSKGTNTDSSIKAIEAIEENIVLIAGGYDKRIEFDEFIKSFKNRVKSLVLLGQTSQQIKETALAYGFKEIFLAGDMKEAVNLAYKLSKSGDNILLSPACASWGMFKNFEERGKVFKSIVASLGDDGIE
nr:UDP-N-acetylmuramoyl-L-alanine--D-glutamate ligase [Tissierella sp.]